MNPTELFQILTVERSCLAEVHRAIVRNDKIFLLAHPECGRRFPFRYAIRLAVPINDNGL
jgi:hypothetical protein